MSGPQLKTENQVMAYRWTFIKDLFLYTGTTFDFFHSEENTNLKIGFENKFYGWQDKVSR